MTKLTLLAAGAAIAITSASHAADLPVKAHGPMVPAMAVSNWTGFYAGLNAGYATSNVSPGLGVGDDTVDGFVGGGQIGYNWQPMGSPLVLGVEGDLQASGQSNSGTGYTEHSQWFGTVRGRLGYAAGNLMPYITGGGIWQDARASISGVGSGSKTINGWTLGGGVEWMFAPRWSAKVEYLYADFGTPSYSAGATTLTANITENLVRIGLNYHF